MDPARGERLLAIANRLTLARLALVGVLAAVAAAAPASIGWPEAALLAALWGTDLLDGHIARRGWRSGATARTDGRVLDPVVDDAAYVVGFAVLLAAGVVPLWLLLLVALMRTVLTLTRMAGMAQGRPFARARVSGKVMGVALAAGQCALALGAVTQLDATARSLLLAAMAATSAVALLDFAYANRRVYGELVRPLPGAGARRPLTPAPVFAPRAEARGRWAPAAADRRPLERVDEPVAAERVAAHV